jgi:thioredoxin reductase (NADPH)
VARPVIVAVCRDPDVLAEVEHELEKRYAIDYELRFGGDRDAGVELLRTLAAEQRAVALVIAGEGLGEASSMDVFTAARATFPSARRALLVTAWDRPVQASVLRAATQGSIDVWLVRPTAAGLIEEFHHGVADALYSWSSVNRPFELVRLVGAASSRRSHELHDLLARNRVPFGYYDVASADARRLLEEWGVSGDRLPVLAIGERNVLVQPSLAALAGALGAETRPRLGRYDLVVIGAGPAGLAAAVSAASEGLATLVLEREAIGGQAGTSSWIRNYLGFPMGISGSELALRAFHQSLLFGVEFVFANPAVGLDVGGPEQVISLADGGEVRSRSVVIASGMRYRRLGVPELEARIGVGVYYGAATTEAQAVAGLDVCVVGGGNSAGQAALKLAQHARHVTVLVRGSSLAESMSNYLIRDLERAPQVEVRFNVEVVGGEGEPMLRTITLCDVTSGDEETVPTSALFVLIGGEPATDWMPPSITLDRWGYILTGADVERPSGTAKPTQFETAVPSVYAVGDVRHGSTKRVASAVGEGSECIRQVYQQRAGAPTQR